MCSLCMTVCPNRANQMYTVEPMLVDLPTLCVDESELMVSGTMQFATEQRYQIVNIADFCNECGNCTTFCPTSGAPYRDKPRVHLSQDGFDNATYDSFFIRKTPDRTEVKARFDGTMHSLEMVGHDVRYRGQGVLVLFDQNLKMREATPLDDMRDGTEVDLSIAAQMLVIARAASVVPSK